MKWSERDRAPKPLADRVVGALFGALLKIYCACTWRRPAALGMLVYRLYIPLPAIRRSPPATRSLGFLEVPFRGASSFNDVKP